MSTRVASALVRYISDLPGDSKFILVEGVSDELAKNISSYWTDSLPPLLIGSASAEHSGHHSLQGRSGTQLRNIYPIGVCVVECEGFQIPDRQSVAKFLNVSPSDLLCSAAGLSKLATAAPKVDLDGPLRHVRQAILQAPAQYRPTPSQVANYLDAIASGGRVEMELPRLGAFPDPHAGAEFNVDRLGDNLRLAREIIGGDGPVSNEFRRRAERVLGRDVSRPRDLVEFVRLLHTGDQQIWRFIDYDEAKDILEGTVPDLVTAVLTELSDWKIALEKEADSQADDVAWDEFRDHARALRRGEEKRGAANALLALDRSNNGGVFQDKTRRKLVSLLKDRSIASDGCPEELFVRGISTLATPLTRIALVAPDLPLKTDSRGSAQKAATLAVGAFRLKPLLLAMESEFRVEVDAELLMRPLDILERSDEALFSDLFRQARIGEDGALPSLQIKLIGTDVRDSVEIRWRPCADDIAFLRAVIEFSKAAVPALTLVMGNYPSPANFASAREVSIRDVPRFAVDLGRDLVQVARDLNESGASPGLLKGWAETWSAAVTAARSIDDPNKLEILGLAGAVEGIGAVGLGPLSPPKAEWTAALLTELSGLVMQAVRTAETAGDANKLDETEAMTASARALSRTTSSHYPAFLRTGSNDRPLLPVMEGRFWAVYASEFIQLDDEYAEDSVSKVVDRLLTLQPEIGKHLKILAFGPNAASIVLRLILRRLETRVGRAVLERCELLCVGSRPEAEALANADRALSDRRHLLQIKYFRDFAQAKELIPHTTGFPLAHIAIVTGLTGAVGRLTLDTSVVDLPEPDDDVLLTPKTWLRPGTRRRIMLMPPGVTTTGALWLQLMSAIDDAWQDGRKVRIPELSTSTAEVRDYLRAAHDMGMWVATIDRYASRETLERALGTDVAILHQERRLSAESPVGLVISQKSGSTADRAVARSLRAAGIIADEAASAAIGQRLREVASQGYGILALEAATTGSGINELVAHVVAFSLLGDRATPWPLPPGCRVLLISLDEYANWFPNSKRADLLALAIDTENCAVHVAAIEVKARRSDSGAAVTQAIDQLRQTLSATRFAAHPDANHLYGRIWLNRIAGAAYAVAREIAFRLDADEIEALEAFRRGQGAHEWAALALVFGPDLEDGERHLTQPRFGDLVPIAVNTVKLDEALLKKAVNVQLTELRTVDTSRGPLPGGRVRRRPEKGRPRQDDRQPEAADDTTIDVEEEISAAEANNVSIDTTSTTPTAAPDAALPIEEPIAAPVPATVAGFTPPLLGWDLTTNEEVRWHAAGPHAQLKNGHMEIWGASGAGKTQFTMSLLAQLSATCGTQFGIADFKNDYAGSFPEIAKGRFFDLWSDGAPYNPLALSIRDERSIEAAVIEVRDIVDVAAKSYMSMGHRQLEKLRAALIKAYQSAGKEGRWPTLKTLDDLLDDDLRGVVGDLTRNRLFRDGPPLGDVIEENAIFGLSNIPGTGLTTILAGGFILSALMQKMLTMPQVANTIRYVAVVDEAHRVSGFRAIQTMVREGRSKGLAVILATQQPNDLPQEAATNAQTKICFQLDAIMARAAARRLDPSDRALADHIRTLGTGEAFVALGNGSPRLIRMSQLWRDHSALGLS
jgi:hypothetical protein